jgi:uncharacterized membrane protein YdjX (TVP38/TMEM64 family)
MAAAKPALNKSLLIKLAVIGAAVGVAGVLILRGYDWRAIIEYCLNVIRDAGPWAFFGAMAVLPAGGFPLAPFTLTAGPAFGPSLGLPVVIALTCAAIFVNVLLSYVLARWLLHPLVEKLVIRLGYRMPRIGPDNYWDISILLRVTPGPPFFVQSYLLGLAHVPLRIYLICSLAVAWSYAAAFVVFGDALLHGRGRMVIVGFSLLGTLGVAAQLVRKHFARKRAAAAAELAEATEAKTS